MTKDRPKPAPRLSFGSTILLTRPYINAHPLSGLRHFRSERPFDHQHSTFVFSAVHTLMNGSSPTHRPAV